ncbi:MAG: transposase, partial [Symploca sp. SIO1B1]|nr:transposase [Symploca sp. SIO1B1]
MNARNNIVQVLEVRFECVTQELKQTIEKFDDLELLGELLTQAVKSPSLEAFESIVS